MLVRIQTKLINMIASLEESKRLAETEQEEALAYLKQAEKLHQDLQQQMNEFYNYKDSLYEKAADKAEDIVEQAKAEADKVIRDLRKMRIEKHAEVKEHELIDAKKRLEEAAPKIEKIEKSIFNERKRNIPLHLGMR